MPFDLDQLIADCGTAVKDPAPTKAVRDIVARAVSDPKAMLGVLGTHVLATRNRTVFAKVV